VFILGLIGCVAGLRVFFLVLPILGFIAGFFVGAAGVNAIFGDGFLSTVTGWIVGFLVALLFAVAAYFLWYVGVLLVAGSWGALLGSALMSAFNVDSGWVIFIVSAIGAIVVVLAALILNLPVYIVLVETAFVGAAGMLAGIMLVFNVIDHDDLGNGVTWTAINESWFWFLLWMVIAVVGVLIQLTSIAVARLPEERWVAAQPA
jgi:Domain of unknown function (DUF4203)